MNKNRLEAFSDGVMAIIITIMVLDIKVPHGTDWVTLKPITPVFFSYIISFLLVGIYWGNHHNLLHAVKSISSGMIMSNLNLLFWLSLIPVATGWMGENHFAPNTIILYTCLLLVCGFSYSILQNIILKSIGEENKLAIAIRKQNKKVMLSAIGAVTAIPFAFVHPAISGIILFLQSAIWLIPDRNIEAALKD